MCTLIRLYVNQFMGLATADNLLENFSDVINNIDGGNRMIQVSTDGSQTNWKLFNLLQNDRAEKKQHKLIDIGFCSLQIIHGAFKSGGESCGWNMKVVLKGAFTILHGTPAGREVTFQLQEKKRFLCTFVQRDEWRIQLLQICCGDSGQHNQNCYVLLRSH